MKILLTNLTLATRTGTEVVTRDLASGLLRAGHEPCVFSPRLGPIAKEIAREGIAVVDQLEDVPFRPDVIHGHHHVETTLALMYFRSVPGIFVCHDRLSAHDSPPRNDAIRRYVAVDHNCLERLIIEAGVPAARTCVIPNAVDLRRFARRKGLSATPRRALVFSNYARDGADLEVLREACRDAGLEFAALGSGVGAQAFRPEEILGDYDVVFAKARCALEALAVGCAVILCDWQGVGPMVTSSQVSELRKWNFGMRCLQGRLSQSAVRGQIARYDREDAERVSAFIRSDASLDAAVSKYVELYEEVLAESRKTCVSAGEIVESLVHKVASLQSALRSAGEPFAMPPLPRTIGSEIRLGLLEKIPRIRAGVVARCFVELDNRSAEVLLTQPPFPVHFSYHWLDAGSRECIVFDGERTALSAPIRARSRHSQSLDVLPPREAGRYVLVLTLVQEDQFWFNAISPPVAIEVSVVVNPQACDLQLSEMTLSEVAPWAGARVVRDGRFANLGFLSDPKERMLTFVESKRFTSEARACQDMRCVLTTPELADAFPECLAVAVTDDPRRSFFKIHNQLVNDTEFYGGGFASTVHPSARLHPRCFVDDRNVTIAEGVIVEANAVVQGRVSIGKGTTIYAGAVIGSAGFQTSNRCGDLIELRHAGGVEIGEACHILANAVIARGLFRENTRIGNQCRIGNCAFVSHNSRVGDETFIGHGAVVNGNVRIGANAWIGPGATIVHGIDIGESAKVSLGATVVRHVPRGSHVTGSFAIPHRRMLRLMALAERDSNRK